MKTVSLPENLWDALSLFLDDLSSHYGSAGCNDLPENIAALFSKPQGIELAKEFEVYNNPVTPDGPSWPLPDWCLLSLIQHKIESQLE